MIPEEALLMASAHLAVLPIGPGTKYPPFDEWQNQATDVVEVLEGWWPNGSNRGVGWKMGLQPDGRSLFAIDVDVAKGGKPSMQDLVREFGLQAELAGTVTARTGGGGFHFVFELPPDPVVVPTNRSKLRTGIDVRAEGGQIVVAPTIHPDSGVAYGWVEGKAPWQIRPSVASPALMAMMASLLAPPPSLRLVTDLDTSVARHPSAQGWETPADYVRLRFDFSTYLIKHGWTHVGKESWRRPGKTDRGSSAELKNAGQGPLNVFTTEIPPALERLGKLDATGQCVSITLFDFIAAYEFGGDRQACASWVRREYMTPTAPAERAGPDRDLESEARAASPVPGSDATPPLNLPDGFWVARPVLAHIRQAAQASMCSPDALLIYALARCATLIPPSWKLPGTRQGMFGAPATLDVIGCVVAETSGGKSMAADVAAELVPGFHEDDDFSVMPPSYAQFGFDLPIGSGEGLVQWFMVPKWRQDSEGEWKKVAGNEQGRTALFISVDEGTGFTNQAGRSGTTIVSTVASAFSGATLGQLNARDETNRLLRGGKARICVVINMQEANAYLLYTPALESIGFTGRLMFASAHDPAAPPEDDLPEWPGALQWTPPPASSLVDQYFTYDRSIVAEARRQRRGVLNGTVTISKRQSQHLVLRCKIAAILACWEGRRDITVDDWDIAAQILTGSNAVLAHMEAGRAQAEEAILVQRGRAQDVVVGATDAARVKRLSINWQHKIITLLKTEPMPWKEIKGIVESKYRGDLRTCLEQMVLDGVLIKDGARFRLA